MYESEAAVPAVTVQLAPVEKLPFVRVNTPLDIAAVAPEADVTTVFEVTAVGVFVVHAVISSAAIAVPAEGFFIVAVETVVFALSKIFRQVPDHPEELPPR